MKASGLLAVAGRQQTRQLGKRSPLAAKLENADPPGDDVEKMSVGRVAPPLRQAFPRLLRAMITVASNRLPEHPCGELGDEDSPRRPGIAHARDNWRLRIATASAADRQEEREVEPLTEPWFSTVIAAAAMLGEAEHWPSQRRSPDEGLGGEKGSNMPMSLERYPRQCRPRAAACSPRSPSGERQQFVAREGSSATPSLIASRALKRGFSSSASSRRSGIGSSHTWSEISMTGRCCHQHRRAPAGW